MLKTIKQVDFNGKRVIMRVDFNVPMKDGQVQDSTRIEATLPTIRYILENKAKSLTLCSHLGDPKKDAEKAKEKAQKSGLAFDEKAYMEGKHMMGNVAKKLEELIGKKVHFAPDCIGNEAMLNQMKDGEILVLENTRFHKEETSKDEGERRKMAEALAKYGDIYVNDAFGTAHRAHASTETITQFLPSYAGFLIEKEIEAFKPFLENPKRPFVAVVGGAKISSKIDVLKSFIKNANALIIGGGMAYTFLKAQGHGIGNSLVEDDQIETAKNILNEAHSKGIKVVLPVDHIVSNSFEDKPGTLLSSIDIPDGKMALDIGPKTIELCKEIIEGAKSVIWNGPMGVFEFENFGKGTKEVGTLIANCGAFTAVGGGDSVSACNKFGLSDKMGHVSTGGGASLELLEGKILPGIKVLET